MPANYLSGTLASVTVGGNNYNFAKWRIPMQNGVPRVNNFSSAYQLLVIGLTKGTIYLEGPYDGGNMPLTAGNQYAVVLKWSASLSIAVTARVSELTPDDNVEDAARLAVQLESDGAFTAAVT